MPPHGSQKKKLNGQRITDIMQNIARLVMYEVFLWGTADKPLTMTVTHYCQKVLTPRSSACYWKVNAPLRKFDNEQQIAIDNDPSGEHFDVTLLYKVIKLACRDVAPFNDNSWKPGSDTFESLLSAIKKERNLVSHGSLNLDDMQFRNKVKFLRELFVKTLEAAKHKYGVNDAQLADAIDKMDATMMEVCNEVLGEEDLLLYCGSRLLGDLIAEGKTQLLNIMQNSGYSDPLPFIPDTGLRLKVQDVYTRIRVKSGSHQNVRQEMDYDRILTLIQSGFSSPQVLAIEGVAGSGKSALVTLIKEEWLLGGKKTLLDLHRYELLLPVQCRDTHLTSFSELVRQMMPDVYCKYRNLMLPLVKKCRLLVLVDGLDECNSKSNELVQNILDELKDSPNCTLLFTSRAECIANFRRKVPQQHNVINIELLGIDEAQRPDFVKRYFQEMKLVTNSTLSIDDLLKKVKQVCHLEYFRLPLNLVILTWQIVHDPDSVTANNTQTDLYHWAHQLNLQKLQERLSLNEPYRTMNDSDLEDLVLKCRSDLCSVILKTLARDELIITRQAENQLTDACKFYGLPPQEMLSAFLNLTTTWTPFGLRKQYSVPHKGLQEFLAAQYVVDQVTNSIRAVLETTLGTNHLELDKFPNLLKHVAGLLYLQNNYIDPTLAEEAVELLGQAGIHDQDQWLDVVEDTKAVPPMLTAIARHFPLDEDIEVNDNRVVSYSKLLHYLPATPVKVDISGDPMPLLASLAHHTCTIVVKENMLGKYNTLLSHLQPGKVSVTIKGDPICLPRLLPFLYRHINVGLELFRHYYHPQANTTASDQMFYQVASRDLKTFAGQLSVSTLQVATSLTRLRIAIASNSQAPVIPLLHTLPHLQYLGVHVTADVSLDCLSSLPDVKNSDGDSKVNLNLPDITEATEDTVAPRATKLAPNIGFGIIGFPRSTLGYGGWRRIVAQLGQRDVNCWWGLWVPGYAITEDQEQQLSEISKIIIRGSFMRMDISDWDLPS